MEQGVRFRLLKRVVIWSDIWLREGQTNNSVLLLYTQIHLGDKYLILLNV